MIAEADHADGEPPRARACVQHMERAVLAEVTVSRDCFAAILGRTARLTLPVLPDPRPITEGAPNVPHP